MLLQKDPFTKTKPQNMYVNGPSQTAKTKSLGRNTHDAQGLSAQNLGCTTDENKKKKKKKTKSITVLEISQKVAQSKRGAEGTSIGPVRGKKRRRRGAGAPSAGREKKTTPSKRKKRDT